jgi:peptide/nickel transport system substrate-binding protein
LTANTKVTVTYPADLFTTVTWHDGSPLSVGDFVMKMILAFDLGKADSPNYDEAQAPNIDAWLTHF